MAKKRKRNRQRNRGENFAAELMDFKKFSDDVKEKEKRSGGFLLMGVPYMMSLLKVEGGGTISQIFAAIIYGSHISFSEPVSPGHPLRRVPREEVAQQHHPVQDQLGIRQVHSCATPLCNILTLLWWDFV